MPHRSPKNKNSFLHVHIFLPSLYESLSVIYFTISSQDRANLYFASRSGNSKKSVAINPIEKPYWCSKREACSPLHYCYCYCSCSFSDADHPNHLATLEARSPRVPSPKSQSHPLGFTSCPRCARKPAPRSQIPLPICSRYPRRSRSPRKLAPRSQLLSLIP